MLDEVLPCQRCGDAPVLHCVATATGKLYFYQSSCGRNGPSHSEEFVRSVDGAREGWNARQLLLAKIAGEQR
jgi:hypothetical protein